MKGVRYASMTFTEAPNYNVCQGNWANVTQILHEKPEADFLMILMAKVTSGKNQ